MSRRLTDLLRYAAKLGYVHAGYTGSGHRKLRHRRTGQLVIVPSTPGRGRAVANARSQLRSMAHG